MFYMLKYFHVLRSGSVRLSVVTVLDHPIIILKDLSIDFSIKTYLLYHICLCAFCLLIGLFVGLFVSFFSWFSLSVCAYVFVRMGVCVCVRMGVCVCVRVLTCVCARAGVPLIPFSLTRGPIAFHVNELFSSSPNYPPHTNPHWPNTNPHWPNTNPH